MENPKDIHLLYKKLGETPLECLSRFKKESPEYADIPMTYAGRLDPMTEGVLVALSGEKVKEKEKYLGLSKTYVFQILWGVGTDSQDLLGLVVESHKVHKVPSESEIRMVLEKSIGKFEQKYPHYSSKSIAARFKGKEVLEESHEVEVYNAKFISRKTVSNSDFLRYIVRNISLVTGAFRQKEILEKWKETLSKGAFDTWVIDTIRVEVSSGFYVRQFVSDLAEKLNTCATTFHIQRTQVG